MHLMIADYFTNLLKRKLFELFCDLIMGYKHIGDILEDIESIAKECVGNQNKVTENSKLINNDERTIRVQVQNIESSRKIKVQVQNID